MIWELVRIVFPYFCICNTSNEEPKTVKPILYFEIGGFKYILDKWDIYKN